MAELYDLIIIGSGIHGAGIAQAAAARGLSVMVLEQAGIANGSSSRSSKLIHGGSAIWKAANSHWYENVYKSVRYCLNWRRS